MSSGPARWHHTWSTSTQKLGTEAKQHYPAIIQNNTINGRLMGMPCLGDFGMLYYRTDLLQQYGFDGPPRTWEQLEQQAHRMVKGEKASNPTFTGSGFRDAALARATMARERPM